jgi:hypothetical protein
MAEIIEASSFDASISRYRDGVIFFFFFRRFLIKKWTSIFLSVGHGNLL